MQIPMPPPFPVSLTSLISSSTLIIILVLIGLGVIYGLRKNWGRVIRICLLVLVILLGPTIITNALNGFMKWLATWVAGSTHSPIVVPAFESGTVAALALIIFFAIEAMSARHWKASYKIGAWVCGIWLALEKAPEILKFVNSWWTNAI